MTKKENKLEQEKDFIAGFELNIDNPLEKKSEIKPKKESNQESMPIQGMKKSNTEKAINAPSDSPLSIGNITNEINRLKGGTNVFKEHRTTLNVPASIMSEAFELLNDAVGSKSYELISAIITLSVKANKKEIANLLNKRKKDHETLLG